LLLCTNAVKFIFLRRSSQCWLCCRPTCERRQRSCTPLEIGFAPLRTKRPMVPCGTKRRSNEKSGAGFRYLSFGFRPQDSYQVPQQ